MASADLPGAHNTTCSAEPGHHPGKQGRVASGGQRPHSRVRKAGRHPAPSVRFQALRQRRGEESPGGTRRTSLLDHRGTPSGRQEDTTDVKTARVCILQRGSARQPRTSSVASSGSLAPLIEQPTSRSSCSSRTARSVMRSPGASTGMPATTGRGPRRRSPASRRCVPAQACEHLRTRV